MRTTLPAQVHAAGGGNYQTLINHALRDVVAQAREPIEKVLRRVVREELHREPLDRSAIVFIEGLP